MIVILKAVDKNIFSLSSESLYSATYFTIPLFIPPLDNVIAIDEKLRSCPNNATPEEPIIEATTFTLISPVNIRTNVDRAV